MSESKEKDPLEIDYISEDLSDAEQEEALEPSGLMYRLAYGLSVVLHPIFMPALLFGLVFYFSPRIYAPLPEEYRWHMFGLLLLMTLVIPLLSTLVLYFLGALPSLRMLRRRERRQPFLYISIFYAVSTYFFISKYQPYLNIGIMLSGITLVLFLVTIVTFYWKISVHSAAMGGVVGFLASFTLLYQEMQLLYPLAAMTVLVGLLMSARLYLNTHKPTEVWVGALLGFSVCFASVFFFSFL